MKSRKISSLRPKRTLPVVLMGMVFCSIFSGTVATESSSSGKGGGGYKGNVVLQSGTSLDTSKIIDNNLSRIFNAGENTGGVAPWADANALMKAYYNTMLDIEIKAINWSLYLQGLGNSNPSKELFTNHYFGYAAKSSTNESSGSTFDFAKDPALQFADVNAGNLIQGFRYDSDNPKMEEAAKLFANNLVNPFPTATVSDPSLLTPAKLQDPKNQQLLAQALADQAIQSTARQALAAIIAKRHPIKELNDRSFMEIMEKEASQYFLNDAWQQQMKKNYEEAMQKADKLKSSGKGDPTPLYELALSIHQARSEAYTNFVLYQMYREMEQNKLLLAGVIAVLQQQGKAAANIVSNATNQGAAAAQQATSTTTTGGGSSPTPATSATTPASNTPAAIYPLALRMQWIRS